MLYYKCVFLIFGIFVSLILLKVILDLEEERQRHAQDTAEGDDVTYMLEKERERLTQQVVAEAAFLKHCSAGCKLVLLRNKGLCGQINLGITGLNKVK